MTDNPPLLEGKIPRRLQQLHQLLHRSRAIKLHWIGILGSGMWPLAQLLAAYAEQHDLDLVIQGSDLRATKDQLSFQIFSSHSPAHLTAPPIPSGVIHTSVVAHDHVEMQAARDLDIPCWSRGELLALMTHYFAQTIACAGTCGKTSTTSMVYHLIKDLQPQPTLIMGGEGVECASDGFVKGDQYSLLLEADESDGTHQLLQPELSVITATTPDHLEYYGSPTELVAAFTTLVQQTKHAVIIPAAEPLLDEISVLKPPLPVIVTVGATRGDVMVAELAHHTIALHAPQLETQPLWIQHALEALRTPYHYHLPPLNVAINSAVAVVTALLYQYLAHGEHPRHTAVLPLHFKTYLGVRRRLEIIYAAATLTIINDYAHNPEKVGTALRVLKQNYPRAYLELIFEPHKHRRVLRHLNAFSQSFKGAHHLVLAPLYEPQGGSSACMSRRYDAADFATMIKQNSQIPVTHLSHYAQTGQRITAQIPKSYSGRVIMVMGAGRCERALPYLAQHFKIKLKHQSIIS